MKILVLLAGLFLSLGSFAQMQANRGGGQQITGRFYGRIVDGSNKGVEAASVVLVTSRMDTVTKQRKEVVIGGMLTAANGDFSVDNVPAMAQYKLRVSGIGYKQFEQAVQFERPAAGDQGGMMGALDKDLGNIKIEIDEKMLTNVTVTADKPVLQLGIDRKIFNVDKNITSTGGTAVDVMKNVPSVNVDVDGNVTLRNNAPQIFVDGRPTNLTLEQIPADAIESVEIITNPSAKFDASGGTAGILNIVLKKQKRVGYAGNFRANVDSRGKFGTGADINVRQGKINFFGSANFNQRKSISEGTTYRIDRDSIRTYTNQKDNTTMEGQFGFGRAGFDYFINNRNTITLSGTLARGQMNPESVNDARIFYDHTGTDDTTYHNPRFTDMKNKFRNSGGQVSFKHNFPKAGNEWTADVTYTKGRNENSSNTRNELTRLIPTGSGKDIYTQSQATQGTNENLIIQTDYAKPINKNSKFEAGARMAVRNIVSSNTQLFINRFTSTTYDNEDRVYAAYGSFSNKIKDFGYQLGLRAESSTNEGILNNKDRFKTEFPVSLFPSAFISQKLTESSDLQLNYSRRINRPNFFQLFPFTDRSDSLNISKGNPDLKPEFTNSLELSFSKIFENRDNLIASVYFKNTNDLITRNQAREYDSFYKRPVIISSFINANRSYVTGLELTARNKITKFWDLTSNINFFTAKIDIANQPDQDQFLSYFLKINNTFKLPHNITFQLSGDYTSKIISSPGGSGNRGGGGGGMHGGIGGGGSVAQGYIRPNYGIDAAIRYEFLKDKRAALSLNMQDVFRTKLYDAHSEQTFFVQDITRRRDPQVARLSFNYRFGKFDASLFKRKNTKAEGNLQTDMGGM